MQATAVRLPESLCQLLIPLILEGWKVVQLQQLHSDALEVVLMLPVTIIIGIPLSRQCIRLQSEVRLFTEHGLPCWQQPTAETPALEVGVGVGKLRHLLPCGFLKADTKHLIQLKTSVLMVSLETTQIQQHPFFWMLPAQGFVERKLEHLVAQTA